MKKFLLLLLTYYFIQFSFAQTNNEKAQASYQIATEVYENNNYNECISNLEKAENYLGETNSKILYLKIKALVGKAKDFDKNIPPCKDGIQPELNSTWIKADVEIKKYFAIVQKQNNEDKYNEILKLSLVTEKQANRFKALELYRKPTPTIENYKGMISLMEDKINDPYAGGNCNCLDKPYYPTIGLALRYNNKGYCDSSSMLLKKLFPINRLQNNVYQTNSDGIKLDYDGNCYFPLWWIYYTIIDNSFYLNDYESYNIYTKELKGQYETYPFKYFDIYQLYKARNFDVVIATITNNKEYQADTSEYLYYLLFSLKNLQKNEVVKKDVKYHLKNDKLNNYNKAICYIAIDELNEAKKMILTLVQNPDNFYKVAGLYALMNNKKDALLYLDKYLQEQQSSNGSYYYLWLQKNPYFESILDTPEFHELMKIYFKR